MSTARASMELNGARKAAILMTLLGEEAAAMVYRQLPHSDVQKITNELAGLETVPTETAQQVLEEYHQQASITGIVLQGGKEYATRLLQKAFGPEQANTLAQQAAQTPTGPGGHLAWLRNTELEKLGNFLQKENPQTVALILAHLEARQSSPILAKLSAEARIEVVRRMAQLRQFSPEVAETISRVLNQKLKSVREQSRKTFQGTNTVSELMNHLEPTTAKAILDAIEQENSELATDIRNLMFTFEDFVKIPQASLREWLANLDKKTLGTALKGASQGVRDHIFGTMSTRAVEMLKEDMEALGPVRSRDVTKAQQEAVAAARKLEAEGKMVLKAGGEDDFIA